jgi:NCS2 family nucleobase:cation symporter-2
VSYSGNIGLVALTGVYSRYVVGLAGLFITLVGFVPKISTLFSLIPAPIIGGATIVMFGLVATAGLRLLRMEKLTERNLLIIAISICIGLGFAINPQALAAYPFYISAVVQGIPGTAISATILNLIFPRKSEEEEEIEDLHHESAN